MRLDGVGGETNQLDAALAELRLKFRESAELSSADGSVILRVREQDDPAVTDELMEIDGAGCCFRLEVGGNGAQAETARETCQ